MTPQAANRPSSEGLLSILVPTWNREQDLRTLLGQLLPLVAANPALDLVVSNNCSPDGTRAYLDGLGPWPRVRIVHQPINYGPNLHTAWLYGQARGRYLWLIGDDDHIEPDLPGQVCDILRQDPALAWVHIPHRWWSRSKVYSLASQRPPAPVRCAKARVLFPVYFRWITFLTSNVMRTDLLQAALPRMTFSTGFWPVTLLMESMAEHPAYVLAEYQISAGAEITWSEQAQGLFHFDLPLTALNSPVLSPREKRQCLIERYRGAEEYLDRLIWLRPSLLLRIFRTAPSLCSPAFFSRVAKKGFRNLCRRGEARAADPNAAQSTQSQP
jgi:hypothetical protein